MDFMKRSLRGLKGVSVECLEGLTVDFAVKRKAKTLIRGLRATSDFDYEFQMALTNRKLSRRVDTVFLMPSENLFYISSRLIKEIASAQGDIASYVPDFVARELRKRLS